MISVTVIDNRRHLQINLCRRAWWWGWWESRGSTAWSRPTSQTSGNTGSQLWGLWWNNWLIFIRFGDETMKLSPTLWFAADCPSTSLRTRSEQALPYFQTLCKLPTWIYLPVKTNFFVYQVKWVEDGKIKISRSEQALPYIFQLCGNYPYLYLFKPDRLRIWQKKTYFHISPIPAFFQPCGNYL